MQESKFTGGPRSNSRKNRAMLLMVITAVMWSIGGIFIKLSSWSPFLIAGARSGISGSIMAIYMLATHTKFKLNRFSFLAGIGLSFSAILFTIANKLTTAANAIVLQYTAPVFILIISALFFRQKMQRQDVLVVCITMGGMVLFFLDQLSPGNMLGNVLGILAGVTLAQMFVSVPESDFTIVCDVSPFFQIVCCAVSLKSDIAAHSPESQKWKSRK